MVLGLNVSIDQRPQQVLARLEGRLDATTTPQLEKKILSFLEKEKQKLLIDFSKITYLSSAGMRLLLSATKKLKARGGKLVFSAMSDDVMKIIKMAGFERILEIYSTEAEALKALT
ncbi:MAG: STAS domain-containing protein [Chlamydiales bacterium]